ncbi:MAG: hypothetical protein M1821_006511 [Bathelium mastoideum]|nr:MAG: hypothetical protein M1821_006511 [Bathelium mastoideum]
MDSNPDLHGGGIRGLSELIMLKAIMDRVQSLLRLEKPPLPADYFDMIGGTSTGGLIAVLLGRLRMSIDEAIESYDKFSRSIFGKKQRLRDGKYSAKTFETIIKSVVASKLGDESATMREPIEHSCKSFVCTVSTLNVPRTRLFRSYCTSETSEHDCTIWEAVRATCAAPTYFSSIKIGPESRKEEFIDGGVGSNNPINELHEEAGRLFDKTQRVACIVSLGTGVRNTIQVEQAHLLDKIVLPRNLIKGFKKLALDSERNAKMMGHKYARTQGFYFRLNVEKGLEKIRLADWEKLTEVRTHTLAYLDDPDVSAKVDGIARALTGLNDNGGTHRYTVAHLCSKDLHYDWLFPEGLCSTTPVEDQDTNLKKRFESDDTSYKTCEWFFQTTQYSKLVEAGGPCVLWIKGPTGCGKSVQASATIERLQKMRVDNKASVVLYFYCHRHPEPTTSMVLVRSLLAQSLQYVKNEAAQIIDAFHAQNPTLREKDRELERRLWDLLFRVISTLDEKLFIVVDGIDECVGTSGQPAERLISLVARSSALRKPSLLLLSSFDGTPVFESELIKALLKQNPTHLDQLQMTSEFITKDLEEFVRNRINDLHSPLRRKPEKTRNYIFTRICERANGIMLYANLALEELKGDKISSVSAIQTTLDRLPDGLYEIYNRNLHIPRNAIKGAEAFCWVFAANRPLTWHELNSGLAIVDFDYSEDDLVEDSCEMFIQHSCGQLMEAFGASKDRIRFIHPDVQRFLASPSSSGAPHEDLGISKAHSTIACKLLACLKYKDLPTFSPFDGSQYQLVIETYTKQPGRGLLSYAVFNWYRHLRDSDKSTDAELEEQLLDFLMSSAAISWLKCAMVMSYFTGDGTNSIYFATDIVNCLERWMLHRLWRDDHTLETSMRKWIRDFQTLMLDWSALLERHPFWIHFIHYQFLPEDNSLRQAIQKDSTQNIIELESRPFSTKSSEKASWPDNCFAIDSDRDFAYVFHGSFLQCYHMQTDFLTAEMEIPLPKEDVPDRFSLAFKKAILCPQKRFLAALFEVIDPVLSGGSTMKSMIRKGLQISFNEKNDRPAWILENEANHDETTRMANTLGVPGNKFVAYLIQLEYTGTTKTSLFGLPDWTETPLVATSSQRIRWDLDDLDMLAFSPDSSLLALPDGTLNLANGKFERKWSFGLEYRFRCSKMSAGFHMWAAVRNQNILELRSVQGESGGSPFRQINLSGTNHLLTISDRGRFVLLLKIHNFIGPEMRGAVVKRDQFLPQQGTIGIFDCSNESWTPLLVLQPPDSQRLAPWALANPCFGPRFSPEAGERDETNQVLVHVPRAWKLAPGVRPRTEIVECAASSHVRILIFEPEKFRDGFGVYPTLKFAIPLEDTSRIPMSTAELKLLQFTPDLKRVTYQRGGRTVISDVEEIQSLCRIHKTTAAVRIADTVLTDTSPTKAITKNRILLISPRKTRTYQIQVTERSYDGFDEFAAKPNTSTPPTAYQGQLSYQIDLVRIQADQSTPLKFTTTQYFYSGYSEPLRALQRASVTENERLTVENLELAIVPSRNGDVVLMKEAQDTILQKALGSFKQQAQPLKAAQTNPQASSLIRNTSHSSDLRRTIFEAAEIAYERAVTSNDAEGKTNKVNRPWFASGALTKQADLYFVQLSRPFEKDTSSAEQKEARQHEVFICIYDEQNNHIVWSLYTLSAGGTEESNSKEPMIAWAIHSSLPLLAALIPGHKLRISHIASEQPPINIAEPLSIETDPSQALKFSPSGRFLLAQARSAAKNAFIMAHAGRGDAGSVIVFDLVQGKSTSLKVTSNSLPSYDIGDEDLRIYRLTRQGAVEMDEYKLPDLIEFERQHLTFLPSECRCATCGELLDSNCNILVSEQYGVKSVVLSHGTISIGSASASSRACDPLILRVTAPAISVAMGQLSDAIMAITGTGTFPPITSDAGDVLESSFKIGARSGGHLKTVDANPIDEHQIRSSSRVWPVKEMVPIFHNFQDVAGVMNEKDSQLLPETVEDMMQKIEQKIIDKLKFGIASERAQKGAFAMVRTATKGYFPFESWDEFREMMAQIAEKGIDFDDLINDFIGTSDRGLACQIPVPVYTFHHKKPSQLEERKVGWSVAMDIGWIEEDMERFFARFFVDDFKNARTWYVFPDYADPFGNYLELRASSSPKAQRLKKYLGPNLEGLPEELPPTAATKAIGSNDDFDEEIFDEVFESLADMFKALSDIMPGIGKAFEIRLQQMMSRSILDLDEETM